MVIQLGAIMLLMVLAPNPLSLGPENMFDTNPTQICDFCGENADWGFDPEWDALLCWFCHLAQNFQESFYRHRAIKDFLHIFRTVNNVHI